MLRPTAAGVTSLLVMNDASAPTQFSWKLRLGDGQELTTLPDGTVAVINRRPTPVPGVSLAMLDMGLNAIPPSVEEPPKQDAQAQAQAVGDTDAQLAKATDETQRAQQQTTGEVVLVFPEPWALDAQGRSVPAAISAVEDTVTLTVDRDQSSAFPVVADPAPTASADVVGGPLRSITFNIRGATPNGGPAGAPRGGTRGEFEAHDQRIANVVFNQLGGTDTRGYVPGVAGLQEVCANDFNEILRLLNERDDAGQWFGEFQTNTLSTDCLDGRQFGNAILRNVPLVTGGTLVGTRRVPYLFQRGELRGYIRDRLNVRGRSVFAFDTHLAPNTINRRQAAQLADAADRLDAFPRIITGDFNIRFGVQPEFSRLNRFYNGGYGEVDSDRNAATFGNEKIDYIFFDRMSLNGGSVKQVTDETSDHEVLVGSNNVNE